MHVAKNFLFITIFFPILLFASNNKDETQITQNEIIQKNSQNDILLTIPTEESLQKFPPHTKLSKKSLNIKIGMSKEEVFKLLGKPTWAESSLEEPLIWIWKNGTCNPVEVIFDKNMKVIGFDEGRAECLDDDEYFALPKDKYLCSKKNKHKKYKKLCMLQKSELS